MSESSPSRVGSIGWVDLTIADAPAIRDFYAAVTGWRPADVAMGDYSDYNMTEPDSGTPAAGICHARGGNAGLPAQWLIYIVVADLDASLRECEARGGVLLAGPKSMAQARYAVIQDPAGAVAGLYQAAP